MKYISILVLSMAFYSCSKNNATADVDLKGKWIEQTMQSDTLSFETSPVGDVMELRRRTSLQNGVRVPFSPMLYRYKTAADSISIELPSGMMENFHPFYFNITGDRLQIDNFYNAPMGEILVFKKLR